jgi:hypothetical protein
MPHMHMQASALWGYPVDASKLLPYLCLLFLLLRHMKHKGRGKSREASRMAGRAMTVERHVIVTSVQLFGDIQFDDAVLQNCRR